jgi:hypothetical protein
VLDAAALINTGAKKTAGWQDNTYKRTKCATPEEGGEEQIKECLCKRVMCLESSQNRTECMYHTDIF